MNPTRFSLPIKKRKVESIEDTFACLSFTMTQKKFKGIPDRILSHGQNPEELILRYKQSGVGKVDHWDKKLDIDNQLTSKDAFCIDELIKSRNNYSCGSSDNFEMFLQEEGRKSITESDSISSKSDKIRKETKFNKWWKVRYLELVEFKKENGHCHVPQRYHPNKSLGKWVHKQRQEFRKLRKGESSSLTKNRVEALKSIGFQCTPSNKAESLWQKRYNELVHYQNKNGHCKVPQHYPPNQPLGKWVHRQRHEFKRVCNTDDSHFTRNRFEALVAINFSFNFKVNVNSPEEALELWMAKRRTIGIVF